MTKARFGAKVGAAIGFILFLIFGLAHGFFFGAFGTIALLHSVFGEVNASMLTSTLIVIGGLIGIATAGTVAAVLGALLGAGVSTVLKEYQR